MSENVLCIQRSLFDELGSFQGMALNVTHYLPTFLKPGNNLFVPRDKAENDPTLKQLIPYVVVTHRGEILFYVRGKKGGEKRLVSKGSIGIGGHINDHDVLESTMDKAAYERSVKRELSEELRMQENSTGRIVALINEDTTPVGEVHLGIVHIFELDSPAVDAGEASICDLEFLTPGKLLERRDRLETWSQIVLDAWADIHQV